MTETFWNTTHRAQKGKCKYNKDDVIATPLSCTYVPAGRQNLRSKYNFIKYFFTFSEPQNF